MPIPAPETLTQPATPEKNYTSLWIQKLHVNCPSSTEGTLYISRCGFDPDTGEVNRATKATDIREPIWEIIANVPEAAAAYSKFLTDLETAIPAIDAYIAARDAEEE